MKSRLKKSGFVSDVLFFNMFIGEVILICV